MHPQILRRWTVRVFQREIVPNAGNCFKIVINPAFVVFQGKDLQPTAKITGC